MKESKKIYEYINNNKLDLETIINDYSAYIETIINNISKFTLSDEDKEEICSDIFYILWKNTHKLDINKNLSSYIAGVTRNVAKEYIKKSKTTYDISDYENVLINNNFEIQDENIEEIKIIENKLNSMKEIDKKVFFGFYYFSKSISDIAKENKISEFSVKQRLYRIRNKIKKEVDYK